MGFVDEAARGLLVRAQGLEFGLGDGGSDEVLVDAVEFDDRSAARRILADGHENNAKGRYHERLRRLGRWLLTSLPQAIAAAIATLAALARTSSTRWNVSRAALLARIPVSSPMRRAWAFRWRIWLCA